MTYRGHVKNGQITLDEPVVLPEGAEVHIDVIENGESKSSVWDKLLKLAGSVEGLPTDMAKNHDHYLYGTWPSGLGANPWQLRRLPNRSEAVEESCG